MGKKIQLLSVDSVMISVKAIIVSLITMIALAIPTYLYMSIRAMYPVVSTLLALVTFIAELLLWGWLANKMWKWN